MHKKPSFRPPKKKIADENETNGPYPYIKPKLIKTFCKREHKMKKTAPKKLTIHPFMRSTPIRDQSDTCVYSYYDPERKEYIPTLGSARLQNLSSISKIIYFDSDKE